MHRRITAFAAVPLMAIALIAAACGGGSKSASGSSGPAAKPSHTGGTASAAQVGVGKSGIGNVVVAPSGLTLYLFEKDAAGSSACYGSCAVDWPPLLTGSKPLAGMGIQSSLLGETRRHDGTEQVTYAGHPVYNFVGDATPGQTNGEGLEEFGGGWDALSPAGQKIEGGSQ